MENVMFTSFFHSELLGTHRTIFQRYHPGVFMSAAIQNPVYCVMKPEAVEGSVFKQIIFFHSSSKT